jgi:ribonuclease III
VKLSTDLMHFQERLGYHFNDVEFLIEAVTHPSVSMQTRRDNQRLEFLGDRVLGLVVADALLEADKDAREGILAPRYNSLVRKECCAEVAQEIELGTVLRLGRSEMLSGGRRKTALLGDAIEAVIAAVFLDGGFTKARLVVLKLWESRIKNVKLLEQDPKTELQEWAQSCGYPPPLYKLISRDGPDHEPVFEIKAQLENGLSSSSIAGSKRLAEKGAATELLKKIKDAK